ncbi:hypothetical protein EVJ50_10985 [Synechococcus sp. RSCCF101]|uniref:hypothetical protein n=1 Tax=Synechococcus sp. RSCCF101 TaxID=2511069 RepID=UPI001244AC67|nr:hypothetical protein [Synechococcus sp. RSCCF101]QEY32669.1 hypothetical protein EVJ50_10985 [Synechococcus sp. RSCCF101]
MEALFVFAYGICFAAVAGGAFALMTRNLRTASLPREKRAVHPEAPKAGDELLYVDLSRERLEKLYEQGV